MHNDQTGSAVLRCGQSHFDHCVEHLFCSTSSQKGAAPPSRPSEKALSSKVGSAAGAKPRGRALIAAATCAGAFVRLGVS